MKPPWNRRNDIMRKKAYLQASGSGKQASQQLMKQMLELLLGLYLLYYSLHWKYRTRYGDHLLFQRLYESLQGELDALAEKLIGFHGTDALQLPELIDGANTFVKRWQSGDPVATALAGEETLQKVFKEAFDTLESKGVLPMGLNDYIMAVCNDHETNTYLLQQVREGRGGSMKVKMAKVLTTKGRKQISDENFALPGRRYPIHDLAHARNALARVSAYGTPAEAAAVRAKVYAKYPELKARHEAREGEKTAAPSAKAALKALGVAGVGAAGAGGGYIAGHRTGMKRDAETPYSPGDMAAAYHVGQADLARRLRAAVEARGKAKTAAETPHQRWLRMNAEYGAAGDKGLSDTEEEAWEKRLDSEMDRYHHDIGPSGRRKKTLTAGAVGGVLGGALGPVAARVMGRKGGILPGAALGGLGFAGLASRNMRRSAEAHAQREANKTKKASALSSLTITAFQDELRKLVEG